MATIDIGKIKQVWRGTYASGTAYTPDDVVEYTDSGILSSYICVANTTGNAPSSSGTAHASWNYLAKGGAAGADGTNVATTLTTQGDLLYRDGSGLQRLPIGTAGKALKVNSSANGFEYGTAGGVLACYYDNWNNQYSATGSTLQVIYTSNNRTLASTSSKMLILCDLSLGGVSYGGSVGLEFSTNDGTSWTSITTQNMADSDDNQLDSKAMIGVHLNITNGNGEQFMTQDSFSHLHAPSSTQVKYRLVMAASRSSGYTIYNNRRGSGGWGGLSHITEMEIGV